MQLLEMHLSSAVKMALFIKGGFFTEVPPAHRMAAWGTCSYLSGSLGKDLRGGLLDFVQLSRSSWNSVWDSTV